MRRSLSAATRSRKSRASGASRISSSVASGSAGHVRGHRCEADGRAAGHDQRQQRIEQQRRAAQVDVDDPAPVGHRRRDAGRMREAPELAERGHALRERANRGRVGDVGANRNDLGLAFERRGGLCERFLVQVDGDEHVAIGDETLRARVSHPARRPGSHDHGSHVAQRIRRDGALSRGFSRAGTQDRTRCALRIELLHRDQLLEVGGVPPRELELLWRAGRRAGCRTRS